MAYYKNQYGELTSTAGLAMDDFDTGKDIQKAKMASEEEKERIRADAQRYGADASAGAHRFGSQTSADAQIEAARLRAAAGYVKGGPVVHVGYKHSNDPMYAKYSSTMDSSLLAKNRKRT